MSPRRGALVLAALAACAPTAERDPARTPAGEIDPATFVVVDPIVREYLHHRKRAVIAGDPEILFRRYPELRDAGRAGEGVNAEALHVRGFGGTPLIDGDVLPEAGGRYRAEIAGDSGRIHVHAAEMYLRPDFGVSGGGLEVELTVRRRDGRWDVVRTDEVTLAEAHGARH